MNPKLILGLIVAAAVAVGGSVFLTTDSSQESANVSSEQAVAIDSDARHTGRGALADFFGRGDSLICNYTSIDGTMQNEGTMYYDATSERYQLRNVMTDESGVYQSGMVNDGVTMYTWSESAEGTFAFAFPVANMQADVPENMPATPPTMDMDGESELNEASLDTSVEYDCVPWTVDESVFIPPTNIEFVSPEQMFLNALEGMDAGSFPEPM